MNPFNYAFPIFVVACVCFGACSDDTPTQTKNDASTDMKTADVSVDLAVDGDMKVATADVGTDISVDVANDLVEDIGITAETSNVVGRAVKGPFVAGSVVTVYELNAKAQREGRSIAGVTNDFGEFLVKPLGFDGWVEVEVSGNYFDELTKQPSAQTISLGVLAEAKDGKVIGNINLFTGFTIKRVRNLLDTQFVDTIEEARRQARADFARIFFVANHTERLSILNRGTRGIERDNTILLWFSASVLKSGVSDADFLSLTDDFANDGLINESGVAVFDAIRTAANRDLYIEARDHLLAKFGDVPPLFTIEEIPPYIWLYNNCFVPNAPAFEKLCVGTNTNLTTPLLPKVWTDFSFVAPYSGAFTLNGNFAQFNNFNRWRLLDATNNNLAQGDGTNNWRAVSVHLKAGSTYVFSAFNNFADRNNGVTLDIAPASDGISSHPKALMDDVPYQGWVGFHSATENSSSNSYYIYYADAFFGKDKVSVFVSDVGDDVEVSVYKANASDDSDVVFATPNALIGSATGRQTVQVEVNLESEVLLIRVQNKSSQTSPQTQVPGRLPYTIKVL